MKKNLIILVILLVAAFTVSAQSGPDYSKLAKTKSPRSRELGIRAGYNIPRLAGQKNLDFKPGTQNGYTVSASFSPRSRSGLGFRTELVFSSQHFSFDGNGNKTNLTQQYIYMPQFTTIGITKFVQLQIGAQVGYLLNAKSSAEEESGNKVMKLMNRLDYGAAGGLEIYPFKGLILGGRYNVSLGKTYKQPTGAGTLNPFPFSPADLKGNNSVLNFYIGYKF